MGIFDKFKSAIGVGDNYEDDYGDDGYENDYQPNYDMTQDTVQDDSSSGSYGTGYGAQSSYQSTSAASNIVNMTSQASRTKISIQEPLEYEDGAPVIDRISESKTVILNLQMLEPDKKRQIFDFVSGGVYALDGQIQKVTKDIYVLTPKGIQVDNKKAKESLDSGNLYQL